MRVAFNGLPSGRFRQFPAAGLFVPAAAVAVATIDADTADTGSTNCDILSGTPASLPASRPTVSYTPTSGKCRLLAFPSNKNICICAAI